VNSNQSYFGEGGWVESWYIEDWDGIGVESPITKV
jgi:hypothetical protein